MKNGKSPSLNGLSCDFIFISFQMWDNVGEDLFQVIRDAFSCGHFMKILNWGSILKNLSNRTIRG